MALKHETTPLEDYYLRREERLNQHIEKLQAIIQELTIENKQLNISLTKLQTDIKYKDNLINRLTMYSNVPQDKPVTTLSLIDRVKLFFTFVKK